MGPLEVMRGICGQPLNMLLGAKAGEGTGICHSSLSQSYSRHECADSCFLCTGRYAVHRKQRRLEPALLSVLSAV